MTLDREQRPVVPRRLPAATRVLVTILILIPLVALAMVPVYSKHDPTLWGFPFFYWYQLLWVFIAAACTWSAYELIARARGERR